MYLIECYTGPLTFQRGHAGLNGAGTWLANRSPTGSRHGGVCLVWRVPGVTGANPGAEPGRLTGRRRPGGVLRAPEVVRVVAWAEACRLDDVDRELEAVADAAGQVGVAAEGHGGAARLPPPAHQVDGSEG